MRRTSLLILPFLFPAALAGQEGTIAYTHTVKLDIQIPEEMRARMEARGGGRGGEGRNPFPTERTSQMLLIFDEAGALMKPVPRAAPEGRQGRGAGAGDRAFARIRRAGPGGGFGGGFGAGGAGRAARETVVEAHSDFADGTVVESREFLGRNFLIEGERPTYDWKLTTEQAEFLGYMVVKATAVQDTSTIEAWFTPQIPVPGGPASYGGLPGMILVLTVDEGAATYTATEISLGAVEEGVIVRPDEGDVVTREEYEKIVAEKLEELRRVGGSDR